MAAFFALLAGLAIGFIGGIVFTGYVIGYSEVLRNMIRDICNRVDRGEDI